MAASRSPKNLMERCVASLLRLKYTFLASFHQILGLLTTLVCRPHIRPESRSRSKLAAAQAISSERLNIISFRDRS